MTEFIEQHISTGILIFVLLGATTFFVSRFKRGTPINKAEEQIFTFGIMLGGIEMFIGLQKVGVGNFRESLTLVVSHLVGAVLINVVAMFCKMAYSFIAGTIKSDKNSNEVADLNDLAKVLRANQVSQDENTARLIQALESNQIKMDVNFSKLDNTLNDFVKDLADRLVRQIEQVIVTLNEKLTVQLGDNFKRLNDAVNNMVIWQNNYKEQLEKWERANSQALIELQNSSASLTTVAARTESFTNSANRLESLIQSLNQSYELMVRAQQQMEQSLKALADVPKIATDKFNEIATTISSCANDIRVSGGELTTTVQSNSTRVAELSRALSDEIMLSQRKITDGLSSSSQSVVTNIDRHSRELVDKLISSTREMDGHVRNSLTQFEGALLQNSKSIFNELDKSHKEYTQHLVGSAQKIEEHTYQVEKAIEAALDNAIRIFAEKTVNILTYAIQTAQTAYSTANEVKSEVRNGRI